MIRLVETEGVFDKYACLSHCWGGGSRPIQTTSLTMQDYLKKIPFTALPKTFGDAVVIARKLGLRYLWIDSLCIIQDSTTDWQTESSRMADIYRNSYVTIAALSSPDSQGGCFSPEVLSDLCIRVQGDNGFESLIAARYCEEYEPMSNTDIFKKAYPVLTRAWVYQERILSRRMLYCTYREFQFECRQDKTCECGNRFMPPHPVPKTAASQAMLQSKDQYGELERLHDTKGRYSPMQMCQHWQKTVVQYTKLDLTQPSDKLPALSGCAKDIIRFTQDEYLAGLWRASFAEGMLWVVVVPVDQSRPQDSRAPTWSWASVNTTQGVRYIYPLRSRTRQIFQDSIRDVECVPDGIDKTGAVKSGYVSLRASLCPVYLRRICRICMSARSRVVYTIEHDKWYTTRSPNITPCPTNDKKGLILGDATIASFFPDYKYDDRVDFGFQVRTDGYACRHARVYLLHLYDGQSPASDVITDFFLVLTKSAQAGGDQSYKRIALFTLAFKNWSERDTWFKGEYQSRAENETVVTIT